MQVRSINVGLPREIRVGDEIIRTGIFKSPVSGPVRIKNDNLEGDAQADLKVHGGKYKAVYAYPYEHYDFWENELPDTQFSPGMFGENLTTDGLTEDIVCVGDVFRIGTAVLTAVQPRLPCFKLGVRFGMPEIIKKFLLSNRPGIYFSVHTEGVINTNDSIEVVSLDSNRVTILDLLRVRVFDKEDEDTMRRALQIEALPTGVRQELEERLN